MAELYSDVPELAAQERAILRRRKIAEQLQQQSQTPLETNQMAGGYVVPVSPLSGIAKLLQAYAGHRDGAETDKAYADLANKRTQGVADAMAEYQRMSQGAPAVTQQVEGEIRPARQGFVPAPEKFTDRPNFNTIPGEVAPAVTGMVEKEISPAVQADPRKAVTQAMLSQYPELQRFAALEMNNMNRKEDMAAQQEFRAQESQLAREQRAMELELRLQDSRLAREERADLMRELANIKAQSGGSGGGNPYFQPVQTAQGIMVFNARTGQMEPAQVGGAPVIGSTSDPNLQRDIASGKEEGKIYGKDKGNVIGKQDALTSVKKAKTLLESGIYTGAYANAKMGAAKFVPGMDKTKAANTETFVAEIGNTVVPRLQEFGGNDSNEEMRYLKSIMGGEITVEPQALKAILDNVEMKIQRGIDRAERGLDANGLPKDMSQIMPANEPMPTPPPGAVRRKN